MTLRVLFLAMVVFAIAGCGDDIDCEPTQGFYDFYKNGERPSNAEAMKHMECRDSEGNRI